jgi:membrane protein implicated in regulation of membrane protease activity
MSYHNILTLAVGAIIIEHLTLILIYFTALTRRTIRQWYNEFTIGAYTMDIATIMIGSYLATLLTPNFYLQILYVAILGLIHDMSFGVFLNSINTKSSKVLEFLKKYAKEYGAKILVVDALMLISTLIVSNFL